LEDAPITATPAAEKNGAREEVMEFPFQRKWFLLPAGQQGQSDYIKIA
jgi:hypothetical protein